MYGNIPILSAAPDIRSLDSDWPTLTFEPFRQHSAGVRHNNEASQCGNSCSLLAIGFDLYALYS